MTLIRTSQNNGNGTAPEAGREINYAAAQRAAAELLSALGADLDSDGLRERCGTTREPAKSSSR